MIMRAFDLTISNCWIQYKTDAENLNIPKKNIMDLMNFRMDLAENFILVGKPIVTIKRRRPSGEMPLTSEPPPKRNKVDSVEPNVKIRVARDEHIVIVRSGAVIYAWIK